MRPWKEDDNSQSFLESFPQYFNKHINPNIDKYLLKLIYGNAIDNILKNGETAILDVQNFAGSVLGEFYPTMIKYKKFLELTEVYDSYQIKIKRGVNLPTNLENDILKVSKLEYEYMGYCTFIQYLDEVRQSTECKSIEHFKEFQKLIRGRI